MFKMRIADLLVQVNNRHEYFKQKCEAYLVETEDTPDLLMEADVASIRFSQEWKLRYDHEDISEAEGEFDAAPYRMYPYLPRYDAFWLHASVVEKDGAAYAFTAPSGYGKSTHTRLWLEAFGDRVRIINGDNPIIRLQNGGVLFIDILHSPIRIMKKATESLPPDKNYRL